MSRQSGDARGATPPDLDPRAAHGRRRLSVAMVGGGIAGLTAARDLSREGFSVEVFDKGRGVGGRASTRRAGKRHFDHGAQYFTVDDPRFKHEVDTWIEDGTAAEWPGRIAVLERGKIFYKERHIERFVGTPKMNDC